MQKNLKDVLFDFCNLDTVCGNESIHSNEIASYFTEFTKNVEIDKNSNIIINLGNKDSKHHIILEAHMDQIGFVVTEIAEGGFVKFAPCGGVDKRILPSTDVVIMGKQNVVGTVGCIAPHLLSGEKNIASEIQNLYIDTGLTKEKLDEIVSIGDFIAFDTEPLELLNGTVVSKSLDNKSGMAVIWQCVKKLSKINLNYRLSVILTTQEEFSSFGSKVKTFELNPDEAIVVDTSFAKQKNMGSYGIGEIGFGTMIGISPILDNKMTDDIINIAKENDIAYKLEVMGSLTGTNADKISVTREGVKTVLLSVPIRYMHTPVEVTSIKNIEDTANLIVAYLLKRNEV